MSSTNLDCKTYQEELLKLGYGFPLFQPNPVGYDRVRIGDVGIIDRDGGFMRFFNCFAGADNKINAQYGVPEGFKPLEDICQQTKTREPIEPQVLESQHTSHREINAFLGMQLASTGIGVGYIKSTWQGDRAAALVFQHSAERTDAVHMRLLGQYMLQHFKSWERFIRNIGLDFELQDMVFVTGHDLTAKWAIATKVYGPSKGVFSVKMGSAVASSQSEALEPIPVNTLRIGPDPYNPAEQHNLLEGDIPAPGSEGPFKDQCIFLRGYCVERRGFLPPKLRALAGSHGRLPDFDGSDTLTEMEQLLPATIKDFLKIYSDLDLTRRIKVISKSEMCGGAFSDVSTGFCKGGQGTKFKVAVKKLRPHIFKDNFEKILVKEMYIWSKLDHPNVLRFEGFFVGDGNCPCLVSRWMEGGTVLDYVKKGSETDLLQIALGIAEGVNYLHSRKIIHSDIKPANILMSDSDVPVLCDFGQSRYLGALTTFAFSVSADSETKGTIPFTSPELLKGSVPKPTEESDVWAFGMTVWTLLTHVIPYTAPYASYTSQVQQMFAIVQGELPTAPTNLEGRLAQDHVLWAVCEHCWYNVSDRPGMPAIVTALTRMHNKLGPTPKYLSAQMLEEISSETREALSGTDP